MSNIQTKRIELGMLSSQHGDSTYHKLMMGSKNHFRDHDHHHSHLTGPSLVYDWCGLNRSTQQRQQQQGITNNNYTNNIIDGTNIKKVFVGNKNHSIQRTKLTAEGMTAPIMASLHPSLQKKCPQKQRKKEQQDYNASFKVLPTTSRTRLDLDHLELTRCPILESEDDIQYLNLQSNFISDISHIHSMRAGTKQHLPNLKFLDLYDNRIEQLPPSLNSFISLKILMLGKNRIFHITNIDKL